MRLLAIALLAMLTGCSSGPLWKMSQDGAPKRSLDPQRIADAVPRADPITAAGNLSPYVVNGRRYEVMNDYRGFWQRGTASWYGTKFHGRKTSNGETYSLYAMTAAHTTLPIPVYVEVTNLENGRKAIVRVNDRGPFHDDRIIDLSYAAAVKLGYAEKGTAAVEIRVIDTDNTAPTATQAVRESYFIQVGAFGVADSARRLQARLRGVQPHPVEISLSDGRPTMHRVRIGPFADYLQARRLGEALAQRESLSAQVITVAGDNHTSHREIN